MTKISEVPASEVMEKVIPKKHLVHIYPDNSSLRGVIIFASEDTAEEYMKKCNDSIFHGWKISTHRPKLELA